MKQGKKIVYALLIPALALILTGCGDYVGKEKTHPLFVKAGSCRVAGNYREAAQYFEEFLYVCPKSALAHYELASVYGDNLDDPFRAMYHYEKYLALSPESSDTEDVKKFSEACRKRYFEQLSSEYESLETEKAYNEVARLKTMLSKYVEYSEKLKEQNDTMRKIISERKFVKEVNVRPLRNTTQDISAEDPFSSGTVEVKTTTRTGETPAVEKRTATAPAGNKTYIVQSGDTLSKISKIHYGTAKYYPEILKANQNTIGSKGILRPGMKLVIPALGGSR